ncbi:beta strand repeat-containing protein [Nostoc sp. PCC 9305]|uniref:beta strand repeat-containing protein n=1 Tax=Nostoc sp. PCC 9305 TaxID=296636 RepID=UPI0039C6217E
MTIKYALNKFLQLGLTGFLGWLSINLFISKSLAQQSNIVPDNTLGAESSQVIGNFQGQPIEVITGGAVRQINLFHSFGEFNVSAERGAYFLSPSADIQNILARVTGNNPSEILGILGTFGSSSPNLFLINPNGIVFGENARLNVQGSFVGTTANGVQFSNQGNFSATNPKTVPLLTINPSALLFNQINQGEIINRSSQLATLGSLYLIGGDITFDGGIAGSQGNRLELGAVAGGTGNVELIGSGNQMQLAFPEGLSKADIVLQNNALAATNGGGAITVNARNISLSGSSFISSTLQSGEGQPSIAAGDVVVNATGDVTLDNLSGIVSLGLENSLGDTGNVAINAESIRLTNQSQIGSNGTRSRGNIILNAKDNVSLDNNSFINTTGILNSMGKSGDIRITTQNINLSNQSKINSTNIGQGQGGKITLNAQEAISLNSESNISSSSSASTFGQINNQPSGNIEIKTRNLTLDGSNTFISSSNLDEGRGGDIRISADDSIYLNGDNTNISSTSEKSDGGNIQIETRSLILANGGNISTQSSGSANSGNLLVNASDSVSLSGITTFTNPQTGEAITTGSRLATGAFGTGKSGELTINTQRLSLNDGGDITTSTELGLGGNLTINAKDSVEVVGRSPNASSTISTSTFGSGNAGSLNISTGRLSIRDSGVVTALTSGTGKAGNLTIDAKGSVEVVGGSLSSPNSRSSISTITFGSGDAGSMRINAASFSIRDGARVSTSTFGKGNGGNLTVNADGSVEIIGSSADGRFFTGLAASAESGSSGNAGDLTINSQNLIVRDGAQVSTGTFGAGKGGNLTVNTSNKVQLIGTSADGRFFSSLGASANSNSTGDAGNLTITTQDLLVRDGAAVIAGTSGAGKGGNLTVNASGSVEVISVSANGLSSLNTSANQGLTGNAGDLTINAQNLLVRDGGQVGAVTSGQGKGGNLTVNATEKVELIGTSADGSVPSVFSTSALAGSTGDAGNLTIKAQDLFVRDGAQITAVTSGRGKAGNLTVNASKKVELIGASADGRITSGLAASVQQGSTGNAGSLTINTQDLLVRDGARVFTGTLAAGRAGNLTINASNKVELIGTSVNGSPGGLIASAEAGSTGDAGNLKITTQNLLVRDGAQVLASTFSSGRGGNLTVNASESVQLIGQSVNNKFPSGLFVSAEPNSTGDAGDLQVDTQNLLISDRAGIFVNSVGTGNAGIITINSDRINLDNQGSLNANTRSPNKDPNREQATINLNTQNLTLRHGSNITTNATGENVFGGNINIYTTKFLIALENSRISANSDNSRGGRVVVNSQGAFVGTQPSDVSKYITATSGVGLSGTVEVNSPDNSSIQNSFIGLSPNVIDTNALIANSCISRGTKRQENSFTITGSGALRNSPGDVLISAYTTDDVRSVEPTPRPWKKGDPIIEPQGLYRLPNGQLILSRSCSK